MKRTFQILTADAKTLSEFDFSVMKRLSLAVIAIANSNIEKPELLVSRHPVSNNWEFTVRDSEQPEQLYRAETPANLVEIEECAVCYDFAAQVDDNGHCDDCAPEDDYNDSVRGQYAFDALGQSV